MVDEVIERMDEYFITREDWDTVVELGLDQNKDELILKKVSTATKSSFTKKYAQGFLILLPTDIHDHYRYNSRDHPIPFHKAQDLGKAPKKIAAAGPLPDLEEALDVSHIQMPSLRLIYISPLDR